MNSHISQAHANRLLRNPEEVKAFDSSLAEYQKEQSAGDIRDLFRIFDDKVEQHEVMMGLVHLVDTYPLDGWIPEFVSALPEFFDQGASDWARILVARIINGDESRAIFVRQLNNASASSKERAAAILKLLSGRKNKVIAERASSVLETIAR